MNQPLLDAHGNPVRPPVNIDTVRKEVGDGINALLQGFAPSKGEMMRINGIADKVGATIYPSSKLVAWPLPVLEKIVAKLEWIERYLKERGPYTEENESDA